MCQGIGLGMAPGVGGPKGGGYVANAGICTKEVRPPLSIPLEHVGYMNFALGRSRCWGLFLSFSGGRKNIARRRRAKESE